MNNDTKKVIWGATLVAMIGVLLLLDRYTAGEIGNLFSFIIPLPFVVFAAKYGFKEALVPYLALLIITFFIATPLALFLVGCQGLCGIIYGNCVKQKRPVVWLLAVTMIFTAVNYFLTTYLLAGFFGYDIQEEIKTMTELLESWNFSVPIDMTTQEFVKSVVPAAMILSTIMEALLIHFLSFYLLRRLRFPVEELEKLSKPEISEKVRRTLGFTIFALTAGCIVIKQAFPQLAWPANILLILCLMIYLFDGLVVAGWLYRYYNQGRGSVLFLVLLIFLMLIMPLIMVLLVVAGALDMNSSLRLRLADTKKGDENDKKDG